MGQNDVTFKLGVDATSIERGLTSVRSQVTSLGTETLHTFTKAFAVGAAVESVRELGAKMLELRRASEKQGVSTTFMQSLEVLAVKFGGSADDAADALTKLNIKIGEARDPASSAAKSFEKFGVALNDADGFAKSTDQVFKELATKYNSLTDASSRAAMAMEIFGRTGKNIAEVMAMGGKAIDEFGAKSNKVISVDRVNALADAWMNVKSAIGLVGGLFQNIAGNVAVAYEKTVKLIGALSTGASFRQAMRAAVSKPDESEKIKIQADTTAADAAIKSAQDAWLDALAKVRASYADLQRQMAATAQSVFNARDVLAEAEQRRVVNSLPEFSLERMAAQQKLDEMADRREMKDVAAARKAKDVLENELQVAQEKFRLENDTLKKKELEIEADKKGMEVAKQEEIILQKKTHHLEAHAQREKAANDIAARRNEMIAAAQKAGNALTEAKEERSKYSLEELAKGNEFRVKDESVAADIVKARQLQRILNEANIARNQGDTKLANDKFTEADKLRESIGSLKSDERFPFKSLAESSKVAAEALVKIEENQRKPVTPK